MVTIYEADTSIDAHLLRGLLEQRGIVVRIIGEALQGGVGELPAGGLIAVLVAEPDVIEARAVVEAYERNANAEASTLEELAIGCEWLPRRTESAEHRDTNGAAAPPGVDWHLLAALLAVLGAVVLLLAR